MKPSKKHIAMGLPLPGKLIEMYLNRKAWKGVNFLRALTSTRSMLVFRQLFLFAMLLGAISSAQAGEFCSGDPFYGVVDGSAAYTIPTQITIDTDCTFQNFPASNPLTATLNFQTNDPSIYLIIFDQVYFTGNMACSNINHKIWFSNGSDYGSNNSCQDLFIPVETIAKDIPAPVASIGVPFTYTLTLPSMQLSGGPSSNDLHSIILTDDLNATGADLTYVSNTAYLVNGASTTPLGPLTLSAASNNKYLEFHFNDNPVLSLIPSGSQVVIEITVFLDDTLANAAGTQFINTAKWWFGRAIDVDGDGVISYPNEFFEPLPGEWGITPPMTISEPNLVVTKTSSETALNFGTPATFTIDVQNIGGVDAWNVTVLDQLPDGATGGMCDYDPTSASGITARVFAPDGVTPVSIPLVQGTDFSVSYSSAPGCQLGLTMLDTSGAKIGPSQHLIINYETQLDADSQDNISLTNVAGATRWFSGNSSFAGRREYNEGPLTDGTTGVPDFQDSVTVMTALAGYYFQKTVTDLNSGLNPATTAAVGDTLRYRLRLFNVDQTINQVTINDLLDTNSFDLSTFTMVTPPPTGATYNFNSTIGLLAINGSPAPLNVAVGQELVIEFDITLKTNLINGITVNNQATLGAIGITAYSDDPYVNGIAPPGDPADPTSVVIQSPGPLSKVYTQANASIGEPFQYRITVPGIPVTVPLYDVRIFDNIGLSAADLSFVSANVVSGGTWTLINTGSANDLVIEDAITGIDIPANGQAVIDITVALQNTVNNQRGLTFTNSASYTYNRMNGNNDTQIVGGSDITANMSIFEPVLTASKVATNATLGKAPGDPFTGGDLIQYVVTIDNIGNSTAYDVNIVDTLPLALSFYSTFVPTAAIDLSQVVGFISTPAGTPSGPLLWGRDNGDGTLDIPAGSSLVLTYQGQALESTAVTFSNEVLTDWTSVNDTSPFERTGADCPTTTVPNDYCYGPISVTSTTTDNNSLSKSIVTDTYVDATSTATDKILRMGDIATYRLSLSLGEGTTRSVQVQDVLPAGVTLVAPAIITPSSGSNTFTYTIVSQPGAGDTGTLIWDLGDILNTPSNDGTPVDTLVIEYMVNVPPGSGITQTADTSLTNTATLGYQDANNNPVIDPIRLVDSDTLTLLQPILSMNKTVTTSGGDTIVEAGETITYTVNINNVGFAPAYDTVLVDMLPEGMRQGGVNTVSVEIAGTPVLPPLAPTYNPSTGVVSWNFDNGTANTYTIPAGETLSLAYEVTTDGDLGAGLILTNAVTATLYYSFDDEAIPTGALVTDRQTYGPTNTATTNLTSPMPGGPLKQNPVATTAAIGQEFSYTITVPAIPQAAVLHDVRILDNLAAVSADLLLVSISKVSGSQTWTPVNTGTITALVIEDTTNGIEIPANEQIVIDVTVRLDNTDTNIDGLTFSNAISYTYNTIDGDASTQISGGSSATPNMTVIEPDLTATKSASNATPGKAAGAPFTGGDLIQYVVTINNSSNSTAYDVNVTDTLPSALTFDSSFVPTATIFGAPVSGFVTLPAGSPSDPLNWGRENGDDNLDIEVGETLVLTYRAQVIESTTVTFSNEVWIDWTSVDGLNAFERTGAGCPTTITPNDYCFGPFFVNSTSTDNNNLTKAIINDTYVDPPSNASDKTLRIGDIATYQLTLNLGEGTTRYVQVQDVLPAGMAYDSLVSITPTSGITYTIIPPQPAAGDTGTLTWDFGTIDNTPSNDGTPIDALVIEYRAKVLQGAGISHTANTSLTNTVTLNYQDADGNPVIDPARLVASDTLTLWQPVLSVSKTTTPSGGDTIIEAGELITYTVDIINSGPAPAYDTVLVDTLPVGLRQGGVATISMTLVNANISLLPVLAPAYDSNIGVATWNFDTGTADEYNIPGSETLRIVYQVTADNDLAAAMTLNNAATAALYYSFDDEAIPATGQVTDRETYGPSNTASVNLTSPTPGVLFKENTQPTAAVGEQFEYRITVPAAPVNVALHDVRILDDLTVSAANLQFISVSKISGLGSWTPENIGSNTNLIIVDTVNGIDVPAGEQIVIEITVEVLNTPTNVIDLSFTNTADYTYNIFDNTPASRTNGLPDTTESMQIVGLVAQKTVAISVDNNLNGLVDPGDELLYSIDINYPGATSVTGAILSDDVPANTTYIPDSVTLNGIAVGQPDNGISPLSTGMEINTAGSASGTITPGSSALITFRIQVNAGVPAGTVISNQGYIASDLLPTEPTDTDGNAANGHQPTTVIVSSDQQVMITKEVYFIGGDEALPGGELEYVVSVTNTGATPTTNLVITDDLTSLDGLATYVAGSATLNNLTTGLNYTAPLITANYETGYGNLLPGETTTLRFRVLIENNLMPGTTLTNTAQMAWNTPTLTATESVSIDIGGEIGTANLNGQVWHDANLDGLYSNDETNRAGWTVSVYRNNELVESVFTDNNGLYSFSELEPTFTIAGQYELRFTALDAGPNTASMGHGSSPFTNGPQQIMNIIAPSGANLQELNLPLTPNGAVYDSVVRNTLAGTRLTLLNASTGTELPSQCFDDPVQQNQITASDGFYKFALNFSDISCPVGETYLIQVTPPSTGYMNTQSQIIALPEDNTATMPFPVPDCPSNVLYDAIPETIDYCEVTTATAAPPPSIPPANIRYYLYLTLSDGTVPGQSQIFNNFIPLDPELTGAVAITKTSSMINVSKGALVPYSITVTNVYGVPLHNISIVDRFPAGFKYVAGSARLDSNPTEPIINGRELVWDSLELQFNQKYTLQFLLVVGSGVSEGKYVNRALVRTTETSATISEEATATVRVVPDPDFDCTDVIGKVFDDGNLNGKQDPGEKGLPGVRLVTARGLISNSDEHGRFHITCAATPDENRGSNFILKIDERSLPTGYRLTTENPRVQRATRGKMLRFNFGATIHSVVRIDIADGVFEPESTELRMQWTNKITLLLEELKKGPSVLRLSYLVDVERKGLVNKRLDALKKEIIKQWEQSNGGYRLTIETEIYWRRGAPYAGQ
jgi:uncharacterized repeat protein (TIGR01451 family)/fimbrial isopeptide formation D2 family protein